MYIYLTQYFNNNCYFFICKNMINGEAKNDITSSANRNYKDGIAKPIQLYILTSLGVISKQSEATC